MEGEELRRIRERLGLTQAEMADRLGIHSNSLARLERGERAISEPTARLASLLAKMKKSDKSKKGGR